MFLSDIKANFLEQNWLNTQEYAYIRKNYYAKTEKVVKFKEVKLSTMLDARERNVLIKSVKYNDLYSLVDNLANNTKGIFLEDFQEETISFLKNKEEDIYSYFPPNALITCIRKGTVCF